MTAIDFLKLLKEAKKNAKQQHGSNYESNNDVDAHPNHPTTMRLVAWDSQYDVCHQFQQQLLSPRLPLPNSARNNNLLSSVGSSIHYYPPPPTGAVNLQPLITWLESLPHGDTGQGEWKTMTYGKRNVCMFDGSSSDGSWERSSLVGSPVLPPPLSSLAHQLVQAAIFPESQPPNHVLLNDYQPGQGILPHTDGPAYESKTATLSIGSDVVLEFTPRLASHDIGSTTTTTTTVPAATPATTTTIALSPPTVSVLLEAGSWIVFSDHVYLDYCHGIAFRDHDVTEDHCLNATPGQFVPRQHRYSLTFRHKKELSDAVHGVSPY
jgi:alkylated DNA repair protein alkB family protein 6